MSVRSFCLHVFAVCVAVAVVAGSARGDGWNLPKWPASSNKKPSTASQTLKRLDTGTKKFIRGTIDVITLKPLWQPKPQAPPKPWLNSTSSRTSKAKKPSGWGALFSPSSAQASKEPSSLREFVGMERPQ